MQTKRVGLPRKCLILNVQRQQQATFVYNVNGTLAGRNQTGYDAYKRPVHAVNAAWTRSVHSVDCV